MFFKGQAKNTKYLHDGDVVEATVANRRRRNRPRHPAHGGQVRMSGPAWSIVGAGPTGVTAATLLAQYGVDCLVLDRWDGVYPQPRAVHLDDEICRIVARLGIGDEFAAISRPALGLQLLDRAMRVLAEFQRDTGRRAATATPRPTCSTSRSSRRCCAPTSSAVRAPRCGATSEVTDVSRASRRTGCGSTFTDRVSGHEHSVQADYVLGCDGANSVVRGGDRRQDGRPAVRTTLARRRCRRPPPT